MRAQGRFGRQRNREHYLMWYNGTIGTSNASQNIYFKRILFTLVVGGVNYAFKIRFSLYFSEHIYYIYIYCHLLYFVLLYIIKFIYNKINVLKIIIFNKIN